MLWQCGTPHLNPLPASVVAVAGHSAMYAQKSSHQLRMVASTLQVVSNVQFKGLEQVPRKQRTSRGFSSMGAVWERCGWKRACIVAAGRSSVRCRHDRSRAVRRKSCKIPRHLSCTQDLPFSCRTENHVTSMCATEQAQDHGGYANGRSAYQGGMAEETLKPEESAFALQI